MGTAPARRHPHTIQGFSHHEEHEGHGARSLTTTTRRAPRTYVRGHLADPQGVPAKEEGRHPHPPLSHRERERERGCGVPFLIETSISTPRNATKRLLDREERQAPKDTTTIWDPRHGFRHLAQISVGLSDLFARVAEARRGSSADPNNVVSPLCPWCRGGYAVFFVPFVV